MMASVEKMLKTRHGRGLKELSLLVFGATGVVGFFRGGDRGSRGERELRWSGYDGSSA